MIIRCEKIIKIYQKVRYDTKNNMNMIEIHKYVKVIWIKLNVSKSIQHFKYDIIQKKYTIWYRYMIDWPGCDIKIVFGCWKDSI